MCYGKFIAYNLYPIIFSMNVDKNIIIELKEAILKSRYQAARLVNRELIGCISE